MRRMTIKFRITLWYALFLLVLLTVFSFILYLTISGLLYSSNEDLLKADADQVLSLLKVEGDAIRLDQPYKIISTNTFFVVFNSEGNADIDSDILPQLVTPPIESGNVRYITIGDTNWSFYDAPLTTDGNIMGWVRVSRSIEGILNTIRNLKIIMFISIPLYILFASLGGLFLSNRALRPIDNITRTAAKISRGDMKQRLDKPAAEDEVGRLAVTFNQMLDKLESFIKKERQFTSDISHELRTPLAVISAQAEQLMAGSSKKYKPELEKIIKQSKKMGLMLSRLLMLYRSEEGKHKLNIESLDLGIIAEDVVDEYRDMAADREIKIGLEAKPGMKIEADQTLVTRMLVNLVNNSITYGRKKGLVTVRLSEEKERIVIEVEDNGIGIAEKDIPHIFDRFYQTDTSRENHGSGLGLSIVKRIVDAHKGTIDVKSKPGQGSTFTVKLPIKQ